MPGTPEIVFIFVAFIVAANLISKYFGEKHERTVKFEEARKDNPSKDGHGSNTGTWPTSSLVIFFVVAALVLLGLVVGASQMPSLSTRETVFIFVAFLVVANLISKHFTMKHKQAMKGGASPDVKAKHIDAAEGGVNLKTALIVFFGIACALVPAAIFVTERVTSPVMVREFENNIGPLPAVEATSGVTPAPAGYTNSWPAPESVPRANELPKSMDSWTEDLPFDANHYPSIEACAAPMARQIIAAIHVHALEGEEVPAEASGEEKSTTALPIFIRQSGMSNEDYLLFKVALKSRIKSEMPSVNFVTSPGKDVHRFDFSLEASRIRPRSPFTETKDALNLDRGKITCKGSLARATGEREDCKIASASFSEKPWLTDFKYFASQDPKRRFYIGASAEVETSKGKARESAVEDVANQLNQSVTMIEPAIVDSFTQTIERPYGVVYRQAVLVEDPAVLVRNSAGSVSASAVSASAVSAEARSTNSVSAVSVVAEAIASSFNKRPSFEFLLAMIVCLTVVAGFISNIATQGYYRTKISNWLGIVTALVVAVILLNVIVSIVA